MTKMKKNITTGVVRRFHDKEKTKLCREYFIHNGKKEGIYRSYYKNGQLEIEANYIDDKIVDNHRLYYENGQLWEEVNYINDLSQGIYKLYYKNGQLKEEANYIDGKKL